MTHMMKNILNGSIKHIPREYIGELWLEATKLSPKQQEKVLASLEHAAAYEPQKIEHRKPRWSKSDKLYPNMPRHWVVHN